MDMMDEVIVCLDKCIHNHERLELLREQIEVCKDQELRKRMQQSIDAHVMSNEAMLQSVAYKLRHR